MSPDQALVPMRGRFDRQSLRPLLFAAALLVAILAGFASVQPVKAQGPCTGVPAGGRPQSVDRNGNGTIDAGETFNLDLCRQITFDIGGSTKTVRVHYTTANGVASDRLVAVDGDGNGSTETTPQQIADQIAIWTRNAWTTYRNYGFNDPMGRSDMNVHVFDMRAGLAGWCCTADNYEIDVPSVLPGFRFGGDRRGPESIAFHEMWHAAEWSGSFGCWVNEGTASNMTDHVNDQLDTFTNNDYIGRVRGYLGWGTETSLTGHCYDGALWWKYFMQETGAINSNLDQGVSAMRDFWRDAGATDFTRMDNVIRSRGTGRTLESLWIDFAVANYAKEYTGPVVTARYRYLDEQEPSAPDYPAPRLTANLNVNAGAAVGPTLTDINAWSSQYYQFNINPAVPIINLEVRQDVNKRLGYVLLLMRNNDVVQEIRSVGRDFVRTFANSSYTRMVLIVVGLNEYANFRYAVNATAPTLNILDPLSGRKALAGRIDAPDKILVKVEVLSPLGAGTPVPGIDPNSFTVTVGSRVVQPIDRISAAFVQGQYWLLLRAPTQTAAGDYNLRVDYAGLTDTESGAVRYQTRNDFDNVLIIDRSGSMGDFGGTPLASAADAARLYVDGMRVGDKVGVVSFNEDALDDPALTLRDWNTTSRNDAFLVINGLTASGGTCIGCGLQKGLDELLAGGSAAHGWALIVLSDGKENVGAIANFITAYNARRSAGQQVPVVHTVALGPDADRARLEKLASDTGGTYSFAALPAGASAASVDAASLSNDLGEIYRVIGEEVVGQQQVYADTSVDVFHKGVQTHTVTIDGSVSEALFVLKTNIYMQSYNVFLIQPDNIVYAEPYYAYDDRHLIWRVPSPMPGDWKIVVYPNIIGAAGTDAAAAVTDEVLVESAVVSNLTLDAYLGLPVEQRLVGNPMPIFATLADSAPIGGASVYAYITSPGGAFYAVKLYDDGLHGDGALNDGFYANVFAQTSEWGSYTVVVIASGSAEKGPFIRRQQLGFNMLDTRVLDDPQIDPNVPGQPGTPGIDTDGDGLPDPWEEDHGLDPNTDDANGDPDHDGLTNTDEYGQGTDPNHSDTDGGGQNDGSEHTGGTDPLDALDDQVPCPLFFQAETVYHDRDEPILADAVLLYYDVAADYKTVTIWRADNAVGPLTPIAQDVPATGVYTDTNTTLNTPYFYWLSAYDGEGHASCILGPEEITRTADPIEPEGVVMIDNGAKSTMSVAVTLNLNASPDTKEMQIRNRAGSFSEDQGWEPYKPTKAWTLEPQGNVGNVFVLFRDGAGNVSEPEFDSIEIAEGLDLYIPQIQK